MNLLPLLKPKTPPGGRSERTEAEYLRVAEALIRRAEDCPGGLVEVVQSTQRSSTFFKRMAALKFHCRRQATLHLTRLPEAAETEWPRLLEEMSALHRQLQALDMLLCQGMAQPRRKRKSKRLALKGLPFDWRIQLCQRGASGKYALALLISALLGARPSELAKDIRVWIAHDESLNQTVLCLHASGAKVKPQQGQPNRCVSYAIDDPDPLVRALRDELIQSGGKELLVSIEHPGNFSKEIQRIARSLWPTHPEAITAYCFRHQWSADVKASGDGDAVSRGLGHRSAKTRRHYGTASQARGAHCLHPVRIDADLPVMALRQQAHPAHFSEQNQAGQQLG